MKVTVNGEIREISGDVSLLDLLNRFELPTDRVAVELNRDVVRKKDWPDRILKDSDRVEIVQFVGGG